MVGYALYKNVG